MSDENPNAKSWNEQLYDWFKQSGKSKSGIQKEVGIPQRTFEDYITGKIKNLSRISPERLRTLYSLTKLECFRYESPEIKMPEPRSVTGQYTEDKIPEGLESAKIGVFAERISDMLRQGKEGIDRLVTEITQQFTGQQKLELGLLRAQQYKPTVQQRAEAIIELLDVLAEEVDYFRTASQNEQQILIKRLQEEPESFSYISQMINIIYKGDKIDSWMLFAQPPSKLRNLMKR